MNRYFLATTFAALGSAHAAILVQDNFDDASVSASINGRTPSLDLAGAGNWTGRPEATSIYGNGAGGLSMNTAMNHTAAISLGAGYFASNPGIYQLSFTITHPENYGNAWVGFGFTGGLNTSANLTDAANAAGPWLFYRSTGEVVVRSTGSGGSVILPTSYTAGTAHTFTFQLNTTGSLWSYDLFVDGVAQDLNGSAAGTAFTYTVNPSIGNLAIGTGANGAGGISTGDNFTFTLVPEPSHAVMLAASAGLLALRRRR